MWTRFFDMHSNGYAKEINPKTGHAYETIYIEAPTESEAVERFYGMFGHHPDDVTCDCCGEDYSVSSDGTLEQETAYDRGCKFDNLTNQYVEEPDPTLSYKTYQTLEDYIKLPTVLVLPDPKQVKGKQ